jgi:hypothetical protein
MRSLHRGRSFCLQANKRRYVKKKEAVRSRWQDVTLAVVQPKQTGRRPE